MKILVIGTGGREHALLWKLAQSPSVEKLYAASGNPGISELATCVQLDINNHTAVCQFIKTEGIGLTIIGPEQPLVDGLSDAITEVGGKVFGPSQRAAQIEGSKSFAKQLMQKYGIPTAKFDVFTNAAAAKVYIKEIGAPVVVKADGLAAGKGVVVAMNEEDALQAVDNMMQELAFGEAGAKVVVEEFMQGEEASLLAFTDGRTVVPMIAAQDHKRIFDGDQGPNTGGMGAYAPAPVLTAELRERVIKEILQPTVNAMREEGCLYQGCLYAGLMITAQGPKVVEFNARFGDPETQVVLPLLNSDLVEVMLACMEGRLNQVEVNWIHGAAVCIVMASEGYPGSYPKGKVIRGLETAQKTGAVVFHAGTAFSGDTVVTHGGRVLGVTAVADSISLAVDKAYQAVEQIQFDGMQYRKDIAHRALHRP